MHIVIIGNGISGITAARHIRKRSDHRITVISRESEYFFSRTALMYVYMGHMKFAHLQPYEEWFWKKNRIELVHNSVESINTSEKSIHLQSGNAVLYDKLIIATGSAPNKAGWPGQELKGVQGLYSKQDLESMEVSTNGIQRAVVVGGGLIGIEMAEMLASRNIAVTFLVREKNFWGSVLPEEEAIMVSNHIRDHHIDLRTETNLQEIHPDESNRVRSIATSKGETIACQFAGLTIGVSPVIDFAKGSGIETNRGVLVNEFLETNVKEVYAIGDCAEFNTPLPNRKPIEQIWYTGRMMGETVAATVCGQRTLYQPGIWFNSAKFFDIEYQVYGLITPQLRPDEQTFYWQHARENICLRIQYSAPSKAILGISVLGMRLRHELIDRWISANKTVGYVLEHLAEANFDPEFYKNHETSIIKKFNDETGSSFSVKSKRGLFQRLTLNS